MTAGLSQRRIYAGVALMGVLVAVASAYSGWWRANAPAPAASLDAAAPAAEPALVALEPVVRAELQVHTPAPAVAQQTPVLASGQSLSVRVPPLNEPLHVDLEVPAPTPGVEALAVIVRAHDGRMLVLEATVRHPGRDHVRVAIDGGFLQSPGRYVVEIETTEQTLLPIRRYTLEVRGL